MHDSFVILWLLYINNHPVNSKSTIWHFCPRSYIATANVSDAPWVSCIWNEWKLQRAIEWSTIFMKTRFIAFQLNSKITMIFEFKKAVCFWAFIWELYMTKFNQLKYKTLIWLLQIGQHCVLIQVILMKGIEARQVDLILPHGLFFLNL